MASNLYAASQQWAVRPADERFWTLEEAYQTCKAYADSAEERDLDLNTIVLHQGDHNQMRLAFDGDDKKPATMTHWSFGQLARYAGAPAEYLKTLPTQLAASCIETGIASRSRGDDNKRPLKALVHQNGSTILRAMTTDIYSRVWNHEVFSRLVDLQQGGWRTPPARPAASDPRARPATEADLLRDRKGGGGLSVKLGDLIAPAGVYASDHDMFAFLVNEEYRIDDGSEGGLSRGFFVSNSEVGGGALKLTMFHYRHVCGNHIVWGAEDVIDVSIRHVGEAGGRFDAEVVGKLDHYLKGSAQRDRERIQSAQRVVLGKNKEEVLDGIFGLISRKTGLPSGINRKMIHDAIDTATQHPEDGNPYSLYGLVNGLTRISQQTDWTDKRVFIDSFAGKLLSNALAA